MERSRQGSSSPCRCSTGTPTPRSSSRRKRSPLGRVSDRLHPARGDLPALRGNTRALAQATWRHLLFGVVLGELERRLNAPADPEIPSYEHVASTNGHGDLEAALSGAGEH